MPHFGFQKLFIIDSFAMKVFLSTSAAIFPYKTLFFLIIHHLQSKNISIPFIWTLVFGSIMCNVLVSLSS